MKKIALTLLLLFSLLQPMAALAQIAEDTVANVKAFCGSQEIRPVWKEIVTDAGRFCGTNGSYSCVDLDKAIVSANRVLVDLEAQLGKEEDTEKKTAITAKITAVNKFISAESITTMQTECGQVEDFLFEQDTKQRNEVAGLLSGMGSCANLDQADTTLCKREGNQFSQLQDAILLGNLVTILEEPISNDNVFNRARICELNFVRDNKGELQKISGTTDRYAVKPTDCTSYIVEECKPTRSNLSYVELTKSGSSYNLNVAGDNLDYLPVVVYCDKVQAIWADNGVNLLKKYVGLIYRWAAGVVGVIAVLVIMISGIQISASNGDSAKIDEAKARITQSIVALAVLFLSGIILYAVNPTFFTSGDPQALPQNEIDVSPEEQAELDEALRRSCQTLEDAGRDLPAACDNLN